MKSKLGILIYLLPIAFLLGIIVIVSQAKVIHPTSTLVTPSPILVTPTLEITSRWATDSGLLDIEKNISAIKSQTNLLNLDQNLFYPLKLNFGLNF